MIQMIALNAGDSKIPSAVMLALPWQAEAAPCMVHTTSHCSVISSSGQPMQDFERFYTLSLLAGFFLLLSVHHPIALLHDCKTLYSVNGSFSFCLQ